MLRDTRPTLKTMGEKERPAGVDAHRRAEAFSATSDGIHTVANLIECRGFWRKKSGGGQGSMSGASAEGARAPGGKSAGGLHCQQSIIQA